MNKQEDTIILNTNSLNLLYIEDNIESLEITKELFQSIFTNIITATDGSNGLNKFQKNKLDLVITDINLPKISVIEIIEEIRKINKNIPVLVLSAYSESIYFIDCIKYNATKY